MVTSSKAEASPRLAHFRVKNYRSVGPDPVVVVMPESGPLVVLGENNAGKSNINRAIEHLFGERWPGTFQPEAHDFHGRDSDGVAITIEAMLQNVVCDCGGDIGYIKWEYDADRVEGDPCSYIKRCKNCSKTYMNKGIRSQLFGMLVGADRGLGYQLSYATKFTLLSKLMHRFHGTLLSDPMRKETLGNIFGSIVEQFNGVEEFAQFRTVLANMTSELAGTLSYRLDIDFTAYDPSNFFKSLRVHPHFAGEVRSFEELGSGQGEILALVFAYAYAKAFGKRSGLLLVIDEPESHLHPVAQQWLAQSLNNLATEGLQIVITTHSPHFVDLAKPENLLFVRKADPLSATEGRQLTKDSLATRLVELGADAGRTKAESVGEFYSSAATTEIVAGLFARACVLVEGRTEAFALPELLRRTGFEPLRHGVAFVSVDGLTNLPKWVRFLKIVGIPVFPILDTDVDKTGREAQTTLTAREDLMRALEIDVSRASAMPTSPIHMEEKFGSLSPQFEGAMKELLGQTWEDLSSAAAEKVGGSKPLVARHVARNLPSSSLTPQLRRELESLRFILEGLAPIDALPEPLVEEDDEIDDDIPF